MSETVEVLRALEASADYDGFRQGYAGAPRVLFQDAADALARQSRNDPARAAALAARLLAWAAASGVSVHRALALRAAGNVEFVRGANAAAVDLYRQALADFEQAGEALEAGRTYSSLLHPLALLGDRAASLAAAEQARSRFEQCGDRARLARLDINIASLLLRDDDCPAAFAALDRAYAVLRGSGDYEALTAIHGTRAVLLIQMARFDEAEASYRASREIALAHAMPVFASQADYNIGALYFLRGQYGAALEMLDHARATAAQFEDRWHEALCDLDQADIYLQLNQHEDGNRLARIALIRFQQLGMPYEEGKAHTLLAEADQALGHGRDALARLRQAQACFARAHNEFWVHMVNLYHAAILTRMGEYGLAIGLSERAESFFAERQAPTKAVNAALLAAKAQLAAGQLAAAQACARRAADRLGALNAPWLRLQMQSLAGQLAEAGGDRAGALAAYDRALEFAEGTRSRLDFDELRISFMRDKWFLYGRVLALLLEADPPASPERVWRHMERAKSQALALRLSHRPAGNAPPGAPAGLADEIEKLREELNWMYRRIDSENTAAPALYDSIHDHERELLRKLRQLPQRAGGLLEEQSGDLLERVRTHLEEAALVEYFPAGDGLVAAVVDRGALHVTRLPMRLDELEIAIRRLRFQIAKQAADGDFFQQHREVFARSIGNHLRRLGEALIEPLLPWLNEPRLILVPHGVLHALPFAALAQRGRQLIDDFALSIAPSAAIYALCSQPARSRFRQTLLVAAEPAAAAAEVRAVAAGRPHTRVLEGNRSTLSAVVQEAEASRVVHIAAHGVFRADSPYFSALELADGRLNVADLHHLRLDADLVVLSGCGTALGDVDGGDESIGLTRGFLYAGARNVVASLWDVDDSTTADFMTNFYRHLDRHAPAAALRATSLEFRDAHPHPFYWAPFQVAGGH